jgi:NAD(P)-dependent dehydrogenase (short-subunit alcohol dehydrogenase family)
MAVILNAPFHATKAALPGMLDAGWGRVVNTGEPHAQRTCTGRLLAGVAAVCVHAS